MLKKSSVLMILTGLLIGCGAVHYSLQNNEPSVETEQGMANDDRSKQLGCVKTLSPGENINSALRSVAKGGLVCLRAGLYQQLVAVPSNRRLRALYNGQVVIDGSDLQAGWGALLTMNGENSEVRGIKVRHASRNADACLIGGKNNRLLISSCAHGGSHKHKIPLKISGTGHLIEDSWFYGEGRYIVQCFMGSNITLRRNVARWDKTAEGYKSEPNAAFSIYNCDNSTIENNISLDYGSTTTPMKFGGDFYSPQHRNKWPQGNKNNYWLGNIVINHSSNALNRRALRLDPDVPSPGNVVSDFYVDGNGIGILANARTKDVKINNCTMVNVEKTGFRTRKFKVACSQNADIKHRYQNRQKTEIALFPWPNQEQIKADMCASGERQSDWCQSSLSLTEYVLQHYPAESR